jgi:hypothetical protein
VAWKNPVLCSKRHYLKIAPSQTQVHHTQIEMHQREVDRIRAESVHLDATLRLFDPYVLPEEIAPRQRWPRPSDYFAKGELTRLVYDAIRDNGTTAAGELAAASDGDARHPRN